MFDDARTIRVDAKLTTDICIIGGGAAGITLAREFSRTNKRVILLESGGLKLDTKTQDLYRGENVGLPYDLEGTRTRFFGGSTNCWGGFCRPFESYHFEERDWVPNSGWPITRDDLDPYYTRAREVIGIPWPASYEFTELPLTEVTQINTARRHFGRTYRDELKASGNVRVILNANVAGIMSNYNNNRVRGVSVCTLDHKYFYVYAKTFILACGGIENARLMLISKIGNDLVGRYFMDHPARDVSNITIDPSNYDLFRPYVDRYALFNMSVSPEFNIDFETQKLERISYSMANLTYVLSGETSPAVQAFKDAYKDVWRGCPLNNVWPKVKEMARSPHSIAAFALALKTSSERLVVSRHMTVAVEQAPNPDSRVTLSDELDELGMPLVKLDWRLTELDRHTIRRTAEIVNERLQSLLSYEIVKSEKVEGTYHHMGTTRMHEDPSKGVVDASCRVHGVDNLYVAGSSVFPTAGNHTPTMTIVALALRLADGLSK